MDTTSAPKQVAEVVHGTVELLVAALQTAAEKVLTESQQKTSRKGGGTRGGASRASAEDAEDEEQMALLTVLRDFFRLLAGEVPSKAHLPLDHDIMKLLVQRLQPKCDAGPRAPLLVARSGLVHVALGPFVCAVSASLANLVPRTGPSAQHTCPRKRI